MATLSAAASPFCRPEEDPFLLLESALRSVQEILLRRRGLHLRRTWIEQPYGEEEISLLEEEVIPAIQQCLARIDELDGRLIAEGLPIAELGLESQRRCPPHRLRIGCTSGGLGDRWWRRGRQHRRQHRHD
jgi:hypothetical protein